MDASGVHITDYGAVVLSPSQNPAPPTDSSARTTLSVTGSKRTIAAGTVNATVRYRNVGAGSSMTALLSPGVELVRVTPQPTTIDGSLLAWNNVGPTGVVKIRGKAQLPSLAARGGIVSMDVALADAATGQIMTGGLDAPVIVPATDPSTSTKTLSVVLGGARYVTPGVETNLTLRYRNLATGGEAVINLPEGLTLVSALPAPSTSDGAQIRWNSILPGSGAIKIRAAVSAGLASGTPLAVGTTILSDAGGNVGDEFEMKVR